MRQLLSTLQFKLMLGYALVAVTIATTLFLTLNVRLGSSLTEQALRQVEADGGAIVAELQRRKTLVNTLAQALSNYAVSVGDQPATLHNGFPKIVDLANSSSFIAGGGFWPEPYALDPDKERNSFFWGRNAEGDLEFFDDYNAADGPGYHNEEWYVPTKHLSPGKCYWSQSYTDPYSGQPMVTCTVASYKGQKLIGATTVDLRLEGLAAFIAEQTESEKTYAFIVDQHNRFITYPRNSIIVDKDGENRLTINQLKNQFPAFKPLAEALEFVRAEEIGLALNHSVRSVDVAAELDESSYQVNRDQANMMATALNNPHRDNFGTALTQIDISHDLLFDAAATAHVFNVPDAYWKVVVVSHKSGALRAVKEIIGYSMLSALVPLFILMVIVFFGMRKILIEPLQQFTTVLQSASKSNTGEAGLLDDSRNDELGNFAYWYNRRTKDLSDTLSELSTVNNELSYQANFDHLTSLINRRQFERRLQALIDSEDWNESALFYLDLDQFKVVNDTCGHLAGDQLLIQVSESLSGMLCSGDLIARIGGDEFAFISRVSTREDAASFANKILEAVNGMQFNWEGRSFPISGSIGVILLKDIEPSSSTALRYVDNSCYAAKDNGRNGWYMYEPEAGLIEQREGEMNQLAQINWALENDSFFSVFQVIWPTDPSTHNRAGLEALIRLRTSDGKIIPPGSFLPAAERYNAISNIDRWMINHTLGELAKNRHVLDSVRFCSINLSANFICHDDMLSYIADKLIQHGIPAGKICFEITENQIMVSLAQAKTGLKALRQLGCQVALDDFGTGMSSYSYLQQLPIDHLKIDGHFVKNITQDKVQKTFVKSIRDIGSIMEIETIAEFVEDEQTYLMLREIGVTYAQGYGVARPMDIKSVAALLESGELNNIGADTQN